MTTRPLLLKIGVIANAIAVTAALVGCPGRQGPDVIGGVIAPMPPPTAPPPMINIAPYGGNLQHILPQDQPPPPTNSDAKKN